MRISSLLQHKVSISLLAISSLWLVGCELSGKVFALDSDRAYLLTNVADTVLEGTRGADIGISIAFVGDLDGDGIDDMVLADREYTRAGDIHQTGAVHVVYGRTAWAETEVVEGDAILEATDTFSSGTLTVAAAGDMDGDGFADFIVGDPNGIDCGAPEEMSFPSESRHSIVHVIYGGPTRLAGTLRMADVGPSYRDPTPCTLAGWSLAGVGDVDGDGLDDIVVGNNPMTNMVELGNGRAHLIYGDRTRASGIVSLATAAGAVLRSSVSSYVFGTHIASAGDVNGDGLADMLLGQMPFPEIGAEGTVFLIPGSATRLTGDVDVSTVSTAFVGDTFGFTFTGAGDLDQDGYDDFLVDAFDLSGPKVAHLFYGQRAGFPAVVNIADADAVIVGSGVLDSTRSAAAAGDVNNDGHPDVLFGDISLYDGRGGAYVLYGQSGRWSGDVLLEDMAVLYVGNDKTIDCGGQDNGQTVSADCQILDFAGASVTGNGDINGDGLADFAIGAPDNYSGGPTGGSAYIVFGRQAPQ